MKFSKYSPVLPSIALSALIVLGTATLPPEALQAQTAKPAAKPDQKQGTQQPRRDRNRGQRPDRLEQLSKELNLTEAQKTRIKPILEQSRQRSEKTRDDKSLPRDKQREQMQKERKETEKKIDAVLTAQQRQKKAEMQKEREKQMQQRRQQGSSGRGQGGKRGSGQENARPARNR